MKSGCLISETYSAPTRRPAQRLVLPNRVKRHFTAVATTLVLASNAFAVQEPLLARVTVYWARGGHGSDRYTRQHRCATGTRLRDGHFCAVDPRRIPYGSKVMFPDGVLTAVDTGSAVVNRKAARRAGRTVTERNALVVDRFFETKQQATAWANSHPSFMRLQVVPPNERISLEPPQSATIPASAPRLASNTTAASSDSQGLARNPLCRLGR